MVLVPALEGEAVGAALLSADDLRVAVVPAARPLAEVPADRADVAELRRRERQGRLLEDRVVLGRRPRLRPARRPWSWRRSAARPSPSRCPRARRSAWRSTTSSGAATPLLISSMRSVPPAMSAAGSVVSARSAASSSDGPRLGDPEFSHDPASFLLRAARTRGGVIGISPDMDADGVVDGVGDGRRGRDRGPARPAP